MELQAPCTFGKANPSVNIDFGVAFGDHELIQIFAQNGLLLWLFQHPKYASQLNSLGLTIDNAFGCLSNFIFQAAPSVQEKLPRPVLQALRKNVVIGLQIRLGDGLIDPSRTFDLDWRVISDPWTSCAFGIEASLGLSESQVTWLLVTDSTDLKAWAETTYPGKVLSGSNDTITHSKDGVLGSAVVDNWLLGLADYKVISEWSAFGRSAALRVRGNATVYTVHQEMEADTFAGGQVRECNINLPDTTDELMKAWYWM